MSATHQRSDLGDEFPITELTNRLQDMWSQLREESEAPVTRIASFNLLVVSQGEDEDCLEEIISGLKDSHPARVIWTKVIPEREWKDCTARLHLGCTCDGKQICSEQVQLRCGNQAERVSSIVLPMIRAGLPTHLLWWKAGDLEGPLFERLSDRAKLVLLVDDDWDKLKKRLPELWDDPSLQEHNFFPLVWYQLFEARQMIASAYNEKDIQIEIPQKTRGSAETELLTAWIKTLIKGEATPEGWQGKGLSLVDTDEGESLTLHWGGQKRELFAQSPLSAVSTALNKTRRDSVFGRILKDLKEKTT